MLRCVVLEFLISCVHVGGAMSFRNLFELDAGLFEELSLARFPGARSAQCKWRFDASNSTLVVLFLLYYA